MVRLKNFKSNVNNISNSNKYNKIEIIWQYVIYAKKLEEYWYLLGLYYLDYYKNNIKVKNIWEPI